MFQLLNKKVSLLFGFYILYHHLQYSLDVTLRLWAVYSWVQVFNSRACSQAMLASEPKEHFWL